jgi:hypothetical protein
MLVDPYKSVGNLSFTNDRNKVRALLNEEYETGIKEFGSYKDYYDYFKNSALFVYYDKSDQINAFEFFEPKPIFNEIDLLSAPFQKLVETFKELDTDLIVEYNGFTSNKFGIGISTNGDPETEAAMPDSVIIFRQGYYD